MTLAQVQAALFSVLAPGLQAIQPTLVATVSLEAANACWLAKYPFFAATQLKSEDELTAGQRKWTLLLQSSASLEPGAQATTDASTIADGLLMDYIRDSVNEVSTAFSGSSGRIALTDLGLYNPLVCGMADAQNAQSAINPLQFTCITVG